VPVTAAFSQSLRASRPEGASAERTCLSWVINVVRAFVCHFWFGPISRQFVAAQYLSRWAKTDKVRRNKMNIHHGPCARRGGRNVRRFEGWASSHAKRRHSSCPRKPAELSSQRISIIQAATRSGGAMNSGPTGSAIDVFRMRSISAIAPSSMRQPMTSVTGAS
jgi:hypothetical protein